MNFCSDNVTSAHPQIMQHLVEVNQQTSRMPYGEDPISLDVAQRFCDIFETSCGCYPVATGTAANALALSFSAPPYGAIFCHQESHIFMDECGAVEHASGGRACIPCRDQGVKLTQKRFRPCWPKIGAGWCIMFNPPAYPFPNQPRLAQPTRLKRSKPSPACVKIMVYCCIWMARVLPMPYKILAVGPQK